MDQAKLRKIELQYSVNSTPGQNTDREMTTEYWQRMLV